MSLLNISQAGSVSGADETTVNSVVSSEVPFTFEALSSFLIMAVRHITPFLRNIYVLIDKLNTTKTVKVSTCLIH